MIPTNELVYRFKLEFDKLDSQDYPDVPLPQILTFLNKAIILYVQKCYGLNNNYNLGFEGDQKRIDDLSALVVKDEPQIQYQNDSNIEEPRYYADISNLKKGKYLHLIRSLSYGDKGACKNRVLWNTQVTHDELDEVLVDPTRDPSFEWQEIPIVISQNKIYGYTDGTFKLNTLYIEYIKYPKEIDLISYTKFNGDPSQTIDSELPDYSLLDIVTLAVRLAQATISNVEGYQIAEKEVSKQE